MMEGIITYRVTPLLKCIVLFLFIFTAKVLTSRPQEPQDLRNGIQHLKPSHYVRTFTKYHHRRTIQWNSQQNDLNNDWPVTNEQPKAIGKRNADIPNYVELRDVSKVYQHAKLLKKRSIPDSLLKRVSNKPVKRKYWSVEHSKIGKRSLDVPNSNEFVGTSHELPRLDQFTSDTVRDNIVGSFEKKPIISSKENKGKNGLSAEIKNYKVKQRMIPTTTTTTMGPTISCLYKIHDSVAMSVTPSYADEVNAQLVVENDSFETGPISETTLPNGEVAQVEQCTDTRASCYTLWHQDKDGNITVLGQGCWRSSQSEGRSTCDRCTKVAAPRLPGTKFCCCSNTYCNADFLTLKEETVTMKAESTMDSGAHNIVAASNILASSVLAVVAILIMALLLAKLYCRSNSHHHSDTDTLNIEKGEVMGSGPDALATGLSCVDNLTLIEHIGQGKFGSVWRGSLGSTPVAVKLYSNSNTWQKEAAVYALPHLAHPNILRYYGSDSRASLTSCGRSQLIVVELCAEPLRARLTRAPLSWREFAHLAHGLAAALAHLHTPSELLGTIAIQFQPLFPYKQSLVSRNKARPPLPKGPVQQSRALKIAADTCDECWDHDAEARLTAVCVEERMAELKQMLHAQGPLIHDNNLHPHPPADSNVPSPPESDKNSNCTTTQNCDVHTPLLYPHPHIGRNACIERNTHTNTQQTTVELIHKSLKDITAPIETIRAPNNEENCLSVARVPSHTRIPLLENSGLSEVRSYQRPLEYVQNDVTNHDIDRGPKQTNLLQDVKVEKPKWGIKKFFEKLNRNKMETEVKLAENSQRTMTSIVDKPSNINERERPSNLTISQDRNPYNFEGPCTLSPPNKTLSPTMMMESENKVFNFKELPNRETEARTPNQIFAVIVPKAKPPDFIEMKNKKGSSESLNKRSVKTSLSSQSILKSNSESEDSTVKKRLSCDNRIINSASSSRASINLELQYMDTPDNYNGNISPFDINSDCSSSEDEHLMLLSENGGSKITMQTIPKTEVDKKKYQNEVLKESSQVTDFTFNKFQNKYTNFDNEFSDPNDKENLVNGYSGDNPVYLAALNGEIDTTELKYPACRSPKPTLKNLAIKRQHSLEQVSEIFTSAGDVNLLNPAGRVKTPGDLPVAVRRARRDRALQKGRASECNRLSLYDDRMMFGNSL
ncbi:hypothetical protein B5X24_HaOG203760 [Helicoverpa armigera]|nr:hypothetical protein B5X24_HaOG203760 [Helicoverpa armigera]